MAESYVPYVPANIRAIEQLQAPPLLADGPPTPVYTVQELPVSASLVVRCGEASYGTPLAMCPYLSVVDPDAGAGGVLPDRAACIECDKENAARQKHNHFVVALLNEFIKQSGCGTSAGKVTAPPAPQDSTLMRLEIVRKLTSDKYETAGKAIKYLAERGKFCGAHYQFEAALQVANDVALAEAIERRIAAGKGRGVRVSGGGRPPCWWDGRSERTSDGRPVRWEAGLAHSFLTPEVSPVICAETAQPTFLLMPAVDSSQDWLNPQ